MDRDSDRKENVVSLERFRNKKEVEDELSRGRKPLFISHMDGKLKGSPHFRRPQAEDFGDRLARIRNSLEKINRLMSELKKISKEEEHKSSKAPISIMSQH